ncbi:MAG: hypothetical protein H6622_16365 [Halobacteriovoraceae bacterium]|nr:hypothetical protein [Halobacteriovoraceae bacterium]
MSINLKMLGFILFIISASLQVSAAAAEEAATKEVTHCLGILYDKNSKKFIPSSEEENKTNNEYVGSAAFKSCFRSFSESEIQAMVVSEGIISGIYADALNAINNEDPENISFSNGNTKKMVSHFFTSLPSSTESHEQNADWCKKNAKIIGKKLAICAAALASLHYGAEEFPNRYQESEEFSNILLKGDEQDVKAMMNAQSMQQMQQAGGQAAIIQQLSQQNNVLSCKSAGIETLDFSTCSKAVHTYNIYTLGGLGVEAAHKIKGMNDLADADSHLREGQDSLDPTAQFKYQKENLKNQAQIQNQKAAFEISKLAVFSTFAMKMPTEKDVIDHCITTINGNGNKGSDVSSFCSSATKKFSFIANGRASQQMATIAAIAGKDGIVHGGNAAVLNKRARDMDDIIDNINDYKSPDYSINDPDVLTTRCRANPLLPECQGDHIVSRGGDMNFTIDGTDPGNTTIQGNQEKDPVQAANDTAFTGNENAGGMDNPFKAVAASLHKPSGLAEKVGVGEKRPGPKGAGQDGGGGANASASGLGRSDIGPSDSGGPRVAPEEVSNVKYGDQGRGSLAYSSGRGMNAKKSSKNSNPLEGLLGKKKLGDKDRIMNFRSPAAINSKNGKSLFDLITNAYDRAEKGNKLIVYKAVN